MRARPLLVVLLFVAAAVGCDDNPVGPSEVKDVTWKLETIERVGTGTVTVLNPEQYTLRLEGDGRMNARADCNTCNARYALGGSSLSFFSPFACTRAFCGASSLDTAYISALESVRDVSMSNGKLVLQGNGVTLRFRN